MSVKKMKYASKALLPTCAGAAAAAAEVLLFFLFVRTGSKEGLSVTLSLSCRFNVVCKILRSEMAL